MRPRDDEIFEVIIDEFPTTPEGWLHWARDIEGRHGEVMREVLAEVVAGKLPFEEAHDEINRREAALAAQQDDDQPSRP
jgi:hypothetical protein